MVRPRIHQSYIPEGDKMSFIENLPRRQIIAIRVAVAVTCILVGVLFVANSANNDTMLGIGAMIALFGTMLSWVIGEPNRNKRRKRTRTR